MAINVLHIRDTGDMLGAENVVLELSRKSRKLGINPIIGTFNNSDGSHPELSQQAQQAGIETVNIPCYRKLDLNTIKFLKHYIKQHNIDLVHGHGYKEDFYAWLSKSTPLVSTNHLWKRTTTALRLYAYIDAKALRRFDKVVAVSAPIQKEMIEAGIRKEKTLLIPNGIDVDKFSQHSPSAYAAQLKHDLGIPADHSIIGMISSLTQEKGHAEALPCLAKVVKQYPTTHILIVGTGPELHHLQELCHDLGMENSITFAGARSDIPDLLSILDVFLLYSSIEGLPMALLEAMAAGKAIVATDVGDVSSAIIDNEIGILITQQDQEQLYQALKNLLSNTGKRSQIGHTAQKHVLEHFSSDAMAKHYAQIYNELTK